MSLSYTDKLQHFRTALETQHNARHARMFPTAQPDSVQIETGYKFDKLFLVSDGKRIGRYMVESRTNAIYGVKSLTQVNKRRQYGTLETVDEFDWSGSMGTDLAVPKPGTPAERDFYLREQAIKATQKKRGRRPKWSAEVDRRQSRTF